MSVKDIIDRFYGKDTCLLKHALIAKAEEDKREAIKDMLRLEKAKAYSRQLDIELMKEQSHTKNYHIVVSPAMSSYYPPRFPPATPVSPTTTTLPAKRSHASIESERTFSICHDKLIKALREKITKNNPNVVIENKRQRTLPKLNTIHDKEEPAIKSLRLPPIIDTIPPFSSIHTPSI